LKSRAPHWADDEIGTLADAFNQMVSDLDASQRAVAEKEQARFLLLKKLISAQEEERHRNAEIADKLALSVKTVETYKSRMMDILGLQTRTALVCFALELGILQKTDSGKAQ